MTKNILSFIEKMTVNEYLAKVIIKLAGDPTCGYRPGSSDASVAASMAFPCTVPNVAGVRKEVYGSLKRNRDDELSLEARITKLELWAHTQGFELDMNDA